MSVANTGMAWTTRLQPIPMLLFSLSSSKRQNGNFTHVLATVFRAVTSVFIQPHLIQSYGLTYQAGLCWDTQLYARKQVTLHTPSKRCQIEETQVVGYRKENSRM
ncbi:hypothetical protein llap_1170 [Limosa lapponica baueri]|uniref:Uncharacterized protein n=1 Tax=Limosa lapponica baueri TaxID=1758121 RepID=A0A2I0UR80_LIMLA|nr:hypothetical protein llap_1170 [Limosa lapponica baueri]